MKVDRQRERFVKEIERLEEELKQSKSVKFQHDRAVAIKEMRAELAYYDSCHGRPL